MNGFILDARLAWRRLIRQRQTTIVFVATLAVGLTAAATATGVVRALLLRPLPFPTLERLMLVRDDVAVTGVEQRLPIAPADVAALRTRGAAFEQIAAFRFRARTLGTGAEAEPVHVAETSASFWPALDVQASDGRVFGTDEETPGRDAVAVLSQIFWQQRFGGAPMIGRAILIDGRPFVVAGIVSARYPLAVDVWVPLALSSREWEERRTRNLQVIALLKEGVSPSAAAADARRVAAALAAEYSDTHRGRSLRLLPLRAEQYEFTLGLFSVVEIVAICVLLVAAANTVTMFTVNVLDGRTESAVRAALGASPGRIARPYVLEAATLAAGAGVLAIALAYWATALVRRGVPPGIAKWIAGWNEMQLDPSLALTTWSAAAIIGAAIGAWSGIRGARANLHVTLASDPRIAGSSGHGREPMLALQAGAATVLLSGALLFVGGLGEIRATYSAYDPASVLLARATAAAHRYPTPADVVAFFDRAATAAAELPGVRVAGLVQNAPASNVASPERGIWPAEEPPGKGTVAPTTDIQVVDPRGLAALGVTIDSGRSFRDSDTALAPRVGLVSRQLATRLWGDRDPLGRRVAVDDGSEWQIVGVVEDIRLNWYDGGPRPTLYLPHAQTAARAMTLVLRTSAAPSALAAALGVALRRVDRDPPPLRTYTLRQEVDDSLAPLVTLAWLLGALAIVALTLAAAGIYGSAAAAAVRRTREIGIRLVLGAEPKAVGRLIVGIAVRPVGIGCAVAVPASVGLAWWLSTFTFGLLAPDPVVPIVVAALLLGAAVLGAWIPSRRAARVDPIVAIRG